MAQLRRQASLALLTQGRREGWGEGLSQEASPGEESPSKLKLSGRLPQRIMKRAACMNGKLNLLEDVKQVLAAPRTKVQPVVQPHSTRVRVRVRTGALGLPKARSARRPLWRTSLEVARDSVAERLLGWTLFLAAGVGLAWMGFSLLQFLFAWSRLALWVQSSML